jgi:diacylglycerol kinase (ATP)
MTGESDHATGDDPGLETGKGGSGGNGPDGQGPGTPWVGIVANRSSGVGRSRRMVEELVVELRRLHIPTEVAWTPEARSVLVQQAAIGAGCRCLVAVGGDGTISALINERPGPPLTVMPAGTENLVARHFGLRRDAHSLARTIAAGRSVPVDVAQAAGRRFVLMAGFGFDADVVTRHHRGRVSGSGRIRPTSRMAYVQHILRSSFSYRFPAISVQIADPGAEEVLRGTTVFIFNLPRYALGLPFVPVAREDDGWLDLVIFRHPGPFRALYYLWKVVCGIHLDDPSVFHRRVRKAVVTAQEAIPVQLDGDPGGYVLPRPAALPPDRAVDGHAPGPGSCNGTYGVGSTEWTVEVLPSALSMVVPARHADRAARAPLAIDGRS